MKVAAAPQVVHINPARMLAVNAPILSQELKKPSAVPLSSGAD